MALFRVEIGGGVHWIHFMQFSIWEHLGQHWAQEHPEQDDYILVEDSLQQEHSNGHDMAAKFIENEGVADPAKAHFYEEPEKLPQVAGVVLLGLVFVNTDIFLEKSPRPVNKVGPVRLVRIGSVLLVYRQACLTHLYM